MHTKHEVSFSYDSKVKAKAKVCFATDTKTHIQTRPKGDTLEFRFRYTHMKNIVLLINSIVS